MQVKPVTMLANVMVLALAPGCVTRAKHQALERDLAEAQDELVRQKHDYEAQIGQRGAEVDRLRDALHEEEANVEMYTRQVASLQGVLASKRAELSALERQLTEKDAELAAVVKRRTKIKESLEEMTSALSELADRQLQAERRVAEYREMLTRFRHLIDSGQLDVRVVEGRMVLTLPMDILFASGKSDLTSAGREALTEVGAGLATIPGKKFQVEGHTDDVPIRTRRFPSNWELGASRALVVLHTLREAGVPAAQISAATFGEYAPRSANDDDDGRALNRRIEIVVLPDLSGLPGYEDLEKLTKE